MTAPEQCKAEILAPAGSEQSMIAAVRCGADAVYLGGRRLNARQGAENFDDDALVRAVSYCHTRGVKVYYALNTLVFDDEMELLDKALAACCAAGADGVIVQDLAAAALVRERAPALALHGSTQMGVHDVPGVLAMEALGFRRVVLARELSRREIQEIRGATRIELECFVHGALCMSVSGQCYLSAALGGRSGNRGLCAQPCRLPFSAGGKDHALSLKDLSLIGSAAQMAREGICSLKIEGRMKRPEYVAAAVSACRQALAGERPDYGALEAAFSRTGFTQGYYSGVRGKEMFGVRRPEDVRSARQVQGRLAALYRDERASVPVSFVFSARRGEPVSLLAQDRDGRRVTAVGPVPEQARTAPTSAEKVAAALEKTGGTPYTVCDIRADLDEGLIVAASGINALRREALDGLTQARGAQKPVAYAGGAIPKAPAHRAQKPQRLRARLARAYQLTGALAQSVQEIALPAQELERLDKTAFADYREKLLVEIPPVLFDGGAKFDAILQRVKQRGVAGALVGGLGGIARAQAAGLAVHGDYGLNIANTAALEAYSAMGLRDLTASFELDLRRLRALGGESPRGALVYGYLPLMTTRNCPVGACAGCAREFPSVIDRMGKRFFVDCDGGASRLYNCVPIVLTDCLADFSFLDFLTLYFTKESPEVCAEIAARYQTGGAPAGQRTRGLYYRGVR